METNRDSPRPAAEPWEGNGPCKDCGGRNPINWHASHELWESVMECEGGAGGCLCPECFVKRAYEKGVTEYVWFLTPIPRGFSPKPTLEGRVTPRYLRFVGPPTDLVRQWWAGYMNNSGLWVSGPGGPYR